MRDSMHILDALQRRGYESRGESGDLTRRYPEATLRVVITDDAVRLVAYPVGTLEWSARFTDGTPAAVILAALNAAEHDAGGHDTQLVRHWHSYAGQTLEHEHIGGGQPHGYFGHPEDYPQDAPSAAESYNGEPLPAS
jgi:hypothetical protein